MKIKIVNSIEEITEVNVQYAHISKPSKWISIDDDNDGTFSVYGMVSGDMPTSITGSNCNMVKSWKTLKGVKNYLVKCSENGSWGMNHWIIKN